MKKHEIQIKPYYHVLDRRHDNKPYDNKFIKAPMRIGDFCRSMVDVQYKKVIEHKYIHFEYTDPVHRSMKAHILFADTIDKWSYETIKDDIWIYDGGHIDVTSNYYYRKYGNVVIPKVNFDYDEYNGPELDWGNYVVFSTLYFPDGMHYNVTRFFDEDFCNNLIDSLYDYYGDRLIVMSDQPERISNDSVYKYLSDDLYDLFYVIGHSSTVIGGQTGFMHFASLCRIPKLVAIYSQNAYADRYYESQGMTALNDFEQWVRVYTEMGQLKEEPSDIYPLYDTDYTECKIYTLYNNKLKDSEIKGLVNGQIVLPDTDGFSGLKFKDFIYHLTFQLDSLVLNPYRVPNFYNGRSIELEICMSLNSGEVSCQSMKINELTLDVPTTSEEYDMEGMDSKYIYMHYKFTEKDEVQYCIYLNGVLVEDGKRNANEYLFSITHHDFTIRDVYNGGLK